MKQPRGISVDLEIATLQIKREISSVARSATPDKVSWKNIKEKVLRVTYLLRLKASQITPPIRLNAIADLMQIIRVSYLNTKNKPEAVLAPVNGGFEIWLSLAIPQVRKRFSLAHELGHTFFYDRQTNPPTRMIARTASGLISYKEEDICNAFARELLIPTDLINISINGFKELNNIALINKLADIYWVSKELMAIRLLRDLSGFESLVAFFKEINSSDFYSKTRSPRIYRGKHTRILRKKEKEALDDIRELIKSGPPFDRLKDINRNNQDIVRGFVAISKVNSCQNIFVLLEFPRLTSRGESR